VAERSSIGVAILTGLLGAVAGSALGQIIHRLWPGSAVAEIVGASVPFGFVEPLRADLGVLSVSFGLALRLNLPAVAGMILGGWLALRRG
jgi:hypothetical protein